MSLTKRKVSVTLDEDLVEELEREGEGLSAQVSTEVERRRHHRLLVKLLDQLDAERGPVDESLIAKYVGLLE